MECAVIQYDIAWEDKRANHAQIEALLDDAQLPAGTFVLLPELGDTGFSFNLDTIVDDDTLLWACGAARERSLWLQVGYALLGDDGKGRNCASIIRPDGSIAGTYRKVHPFSFGREIEYFSGGDRLVIADVDGTAVAPSICYDLRFPELFRLATLAGAEMFALGASWPDARQHHWRSLLIARAIENQAYVLGCNRCGRDPHLGYAGGSIIVSPMGEVLDEAETTPAVLRATLDLDAARTWRTQFPAIRDVRRDWLGDAPIDRV